MQLPLPLASARGWRLPLLIGGILATLPHLAIAENSWSIPKECGSRERFETSLRSRVGSDAEALLAETTLDLRESPEGYALIVRVGDQERTLTDRNCQDLFNAAIVVALAFHNAPEYAQRRTLNETTTPSVTSQERAETSPPLVSVPASPPPQTPQQTPPTNRAPANESHLRIGARFGLIKGLVPELRPSLGPVLGYETKSFGIELDGRFVPKSEIRDNEGKGVRVYALGGALNAYYKLDRAFGVQAGVFAYRLTGRGLGVKASATSSVVAFGPQIGLWATPLDLGAFYGRLSADAEFNLLRSRFEVLEYDDVFESSRVTFQGALAAGYKF